MNRYIFLLFAILIFYKGVQATEPDKLIVDVNLNMKRSLNDVSTFDRKKFVAIHADITEQEWEGNNFTSDLRNDFLNQYDVYLGRNTGSIGWNMNSVVSEDPDRKGYADPASILSSAESAKLKYAENTIYHAYEYRNDQILCAQLHPFWPDGQETKKGWAFSQSDTDSEPFGSASGEYMARYIHDTYGTGTTTGKPEPKYVEVINEPLYWLVDHGEDDPEKVFKFHNTVADQIRKYNADSNIQIGGFCVAFPDFEKNNFKQWEERWKLFMDMCGSNMDYFTIHLYDFAAKEGKQMYRKGSNMEATFDMMEQYSYLSFGKVKPIMISEYGGVSHDLKGRWSPLRDWHHIKSVNAMRMQFMERANIINKTIDFLPVKAEWGSTGADNTYSHRLMRKENEPSSYTGQWVYAETVKLYQLWSDVKGSRVDSKSTNPDLMTDVYVDGNKAYLILDNLNFTSVDVSTNILGGSSDLKSVKVKHLYYAGSSPVLDESTYTQEQEVYTIGAEGCMIIEYAFDDELVLDESVSEKKYYADTYYKPINVKSPEIFTINNVSLGDYGEATLRIGIGRAHGKSLKPRVLFNGYEIAVPDNFRGGDQADRDSFFGVIEIPVPYDILKSTNSISVEFPDSGGYISTVTMRAFEFSKEVFRSGNLPVGIDDTSTLKDTENVKLKLYPNPVRTSLNVELGSTNNFTDLELVSLSGKVLLRTDISNSASTIQLNVSSLANGYYVLRLRGDKFQSYPFIKN